MRFGDEAKAEHPERVLGPQQRLGAVRILVNVGVAQKVPGESILGIHGGQRAGLAGDFVEVTLGGRERGLRLGCGLAEPLDEAKSIGEGRHADAMPTYSISAGRFSEHGKAGSRTAAGDPWTSLNRVLEAEAQIRQGQRLEPNSHKLAPYWLDLVRLLQILAASGDAAKIRRLKAALSFKSYGAYVDRRKSMKKRPPQQPRQPRLPF